MNAKNRVNNDFRHRQLQANGKWFCVQHFSCICLKMLIKQLAAASRTNSYFQIKYELRWVECWMSFRFWIIFHWLNWNNNLIRFVTPCVGFANSPNDSTNKEWEQFTVSVKKKSFSFSIEQQKKRKGSFSVLVCWFIWKRYVHLSISTQYLLSKYSTIGKSEPKKIESVSICS